jgi:hypothetical protein
MHNGVKSKGMSSSRIISYNILRNDVKATAPDYLVVETHLGKTHLRSVLTLHLHFN